MILHANKLRPSMPLRTELHLRKLCRPHTARTNIPHLPRLHQIVKSFHRLLNRHVRVETVNLEEVNIWSI